MDNLEQKSEKKSKNFLTIFFLLIFFPVGLYFMWAKTNWNKKVKWGITIFYALIVLLFKSIPVDHSQTTPASTTQPTKKEEEPTKAPEPTKASGHELDFSVKFSDVAFLITNNENKTWNDCRLEINGGIFRGGYKYEAASFPKKDALIIPFREFTKDDGSRFNSNDIKAKNLSIFCGDLQNKGYNFFEIK